MSANVGDMAKRGRPAGLLLNPEAARHALQGRPQTWWASQAGISPGHLSAVLSGDKGCTPEAAAKLAEAVAVPTGMLFPELVDFGVERKRFTAAMIIEAA